MTRGLCLPQIRQGGSQIQVLGLGPVPCTCAGPSSWTPLQISPYMAMGPIPDTHWRQTTGLWRGNTWPGERGGEPGHGRSPVSPRFSRYSAFSS